MNVFSLFHLYQILMFRWVFCKEVSNIWLRINTTDITYWTSLPVKGQISAAQCLAKCSETEECESVNVHRENLQCELSKHYPLDNSLEPNPRPGFTVYFRGMNPVEVLCVMYDDEGGWTVIQKRESASDFYKGWQEYLHGFGDTTNFWIGLENIHRLTSQGNFELRLDMERDDGSWAAAKYQTFGVGSESELFILTVDGYSHDPVLIDPGDSLTSHSGMKFSTWDSDNDIAADNCAAKYKGGYWYKHCHESNLNGVYGANGDHGSPEYATGINWLTWTGHSESLVYSRMMIRPN